MKKFFKITLSIALVVVFLSGCSSNVSKEVTDSGQIVGVNDLQHDWGDINIRGGKAPHTFELKNDGTEPLYLKSAQTSCMCTEARYRLADDSISPKYGMHNNPTSWSAEIQPGERFGVEVFFDPMAHGPDATGPIQRSIHLVTSAKNKPVLELKTLGNVLSKDDYLDKYPL